MTAVAKLSDARINRWNQSKEQRRASWGWLMARPQHQRYLEERSGRFFLWLNENTEVDSNLTFELYGEIDALDAGVLLEAGIILFSDGKFHINNALANFSPSL